MSIELSASIGGLIVQVAAAKGADAAALCAKVGFDRALANDPDARIPLALETALFEEAARACDDDAFGLHTAELMKPGAFDVLDYAVRTAPTLREALHRLVRYNRLAHDVAVFEIVSSKQSADVLRIEHSFRASVAPSRHAAELTIAAIAIVARQITEADLSVHAVDFRHGRPTEHVIAEHRRIFGVEPLFARPVNAIEIDRAALDLPIPKADLRLSKVIEQHAEALLRARPDPSLSTADRVRRVLASALGEGEASLATVAAKLKSSERTIQRKLAEESVSFDALLDEVRHDLAVRYLADPKIAISEVAFLLGYSEPSPFHRAFKRWTGVTPSEARRRAA